MSIEQNLSLTYQQIASAAEKVSRKPEEITLVAVTKKRSIEEMQTLIQLGVTHVGENRVQDLVAKYEILKDVPLTWHLIGHLQRNKVKYIIDKVACIHSLESYELALEIEKRAAQINRIMECLIEVNISGEATKHGLAPEEVWPFIEQLKDLPHVKVVGLMTMAPFEEDPEDTRGVFRGLRELAEAIQKKNYPHIEMRHLSMGMSNDFHVAVEEGATMVRVGSKLFED